MWSRVLYFFSGFMALRCISRDERPYLERYSLFHSQVLSAYLHRFVDRDVDEQMHDHPWGWSIAIILSGYYTERRPEGRLRRLSPMKLNIIRGEDFHCIVEAKPNTWTLFIHGRKVKNWGFSESGSQADRIIDQREHKHWPEQAKAGRLNPSRKKLNY